MPSRPVRQLRRCLRHILPRECKHSELPHQPETKRVQERPNRTTGYYCAVQVDLPDLRKLPRNMCPLVVICCAAHARARITHYIRNKTNLPHEKEERRSETPAEQCSRLGWLESRKDRSCHVLLLLQVRASLRLVLGLPGQGFEDKGGQGEPAQVDDVPQPVEAAVSLGVPVEGK